MRRLLLTTGLATLAGLWAWPGVAQNASAQDDAETRIAVEAEEGIEILNRGPIHEAFAEPVTADVGPTLIVGAAPPESINEIPPEYMPEGDNVVWIPGYWAWEDAREDFIWISGIWRNVPPGQRWVPGYWAEVQDGWQWVSGFWMTEEEAEVVYYPTPPESLEEGPTSRAPGDDYFWVPGVWQPETDWQWRPGYWTEFQPDWVWVPSRWVWTPSGCIYLTGYWDHRPQYRGYLFAPIHFQRPVWQTAGWSYSPWYVVRTPSLFVHLWVRPDYCHYYFGNYYGDVHAHRHMHSWVDWSAGHRHWDPIFAYNRVRFHGRGVDYVDRMRSWHDYFVTHEHYRPAVTVREQTTLVNNIRARGGDTTIINQINLTNSLNQVVRSDDLAVRFNRIERDQRRQIAERSSRMREITQTRLEQEGRDLADRAGRAGDRGGALGRTRLPQIDLTDARDRNRADRERVARDRMPRRPDEGRPSDGRADRDFARDRGDRADADRTARTGNRPGDDPAERVGRRGDAADMRDDTAADRTARDAADRAARVRDRARSELEDRAGVADRTERDAERSARDAIADRIERETDAADRAGRTGNRPGMADRLGAEDRPDTDARPGARGRSDIPGVSRSEGAPGRTGRPGATTPGLGRSAERALEGAADRGTALESGRSGRTTVGRPGLDSDNREPGQRPGAAGRSALDRAGAAGRGLDRDSARPEATGGASSALDRIRSGSAGSARDALSSPGRSGATRPGASPGLDRGRGTDRGPATRSGGPDRTESDALRYRSSLSAQERPGFGGSGIRSSERGASSAATRGVSDSSLLRRPTFGGGDDPRGTTGTTIRSRTPASDSSSGTGGRGAERQNVLRPNIGPFDSRPGFDRSPATSRTAGRPAPTGLDLDRLRGADRAGGRDIPAARASGLGVGNSLNTPNVGGPGRGSRGPSRDLDIGEPGSGPRAGTSALGDRPGRGRD